MCCFIFASFLFENATPPTTATFVGLQTQLLGKSNFRSSNYFKASLVDKRNLDAGPMIRVGGWGLALELRWQLLLDPKLKGGPLAPKRAGPTARPIVQIAARRTTERERLSSTAHQQRSLLVPLLPLCVSTKSITP